MSGAMSWPSRAESVGNPSRVSSFSRIARSNPPLKATIGTSRDRASESIVATSSRAGAACMPWARACSVLMPWTRWAGSGMSLSGSISQVATVSFARPGPTECTRATVTIRSVATFVPVVSVSNPSRGASIQEGDMRSGYRPGPTLVPPHPSAVDLPTAAGDSDCGVGFTNSQESSRGHQHRDQEGYGPEHGGQEPGDPPGPSLSSALTEHPTHQTGDHRGDGSGRPHQQRGGGTVHGPLVDGRCVGEQAPCRELHEADPDCDVADGQHAADRGDQPQRQRHAAGRPTARGPHGHPLGAEDDVVGLGGERSTVHGCNATKERPPRHGGCPPDPGDTPHDEGVVPS